MQDCKLSLMVAVAMSSVLLVLTGCGGGGDSEGSVPAPITYTVMATAGDGGSISPASRTVSSGQSASFTVQANDGYQIDEVTGCSGTLNAGTYTIASVAANCTVHASFVLLSYDEFNSAVTSYMSKHNIPEGVVAVVKSEQLVYLQSYGADSEQADSDRLFRIASVTKPITMAAVLHLAEQDKLSLSDKVFAAGGILHGKYGVTSYRANVEDITIAHLLEHTSGWVNEPSDVVFSSVALERETLIAEVLTGRDLVTLPGEEYYYLNFGYLLLSEIIETASGKAFIDYLHQDLFHALAGLELYIGGSTQAETLANEVMYFDSEPTSPYGMNLSRMDAAGGLISNAKTLANILVHLDRGTIKPDVLASGSLNFSYFGYSSWNHFGSLPGTSAFMGRIDDTYGYTAVFNARNITDANQHQEFHQLISELIKNQNWPGIDLLE